MVLKQINLTNFRNYSALTLDFDQRPTILVGNNAAGKSNLLEAIYLLSTTKSQRVDTEDELIKEGEKFCKVEGLLDDPETELLIIINEPSEEVTFRKKVMINGIGRRVVDFIGNLPAVIFYPSDINMVTGSPSLRRWHLDLGLAQVDPDYKKSLTQYEQFLTARNRILKKIREGKARVDELEYWTEELVSKGKVISDKRQDFFEFINGLETPLGGFKFEYLPSLVTVEKLAETNGREVAAAATLIGPHRDDFDIVIYDNVIPAKAGIYTNNGSPIKSGMTVEGGRNLAHYGSRGEQRTGTLAFKLAQLEYMAKILGKRPILLLDDVFSELDANHRAHVVEIVGKQQTIIATVELENIPKSFLDQSRILRVEDGKII
ncbi:MAG: DNA replication/repair protein RecF [Candidatus Daviesbacteria bacterium]|nr:DNA replication/repair protein RecF [Candidatus Daviesbacteria bacterium]